MKNIAVLGSTGSIGRQTLEIVQAHPGLLNVVALAAGRNNLDLLAKQVRLFQPTVVSVPDAAAARQLTDVLGTQSSSVQVVLGQQGLIEAASCEAVQTVVTGLVGFLGVLPTVAAIRAGKTIALANKETLVAAGSVIMPLCRKHKSRIVPVDSEHSAIFQSLSGYAAADIAKVILTASGGPFRTWSKEMIANATVDDALRHPNWSMGPKVTIDSATLMNKGLEVIEARWLFDVPPERIRVMIHPQSILHSAVEFTDGSIVGQMGVPDMRLPIHYALFYPERIGSSTVPRLDLVQAATLTFEEPDLLRFPCLALAQAVAGEQNTLPAVLNAANEVAVAAFIAGAINFPGIPRLIEQVLNQHKPTNQPSLDDILEADRWTRQVCNELTGAVVQK